MNQQEYIEFHKQTCDRAWAAECAGEAVNVYGSESEALKYAFANYAREPTCAGFGGDLIALAMWLAGCRTNEEATALAERCRQLSLRKNTDYADPDRNPGKFAIFRNFLRCELLGICSVEAGILVRLSDKVSRCENLLARDTGPAVQDEKLADTYQDLVNYTCLLLAYIKTKKEQGKV